MAKRFELDLGAWPKGVLTDISPDRIPNDASPRARNAAWVKFGFPSKRKGCPLVTQQGQGADLIGLGHFFHAGFDWTIDKDGRWSKIFTGAFQPIDSGNATPFTSPNRPIVAEANHLLFAVNGVDAKKTDGVTVMKFGIDAPAAPSTAAGSTGQMTGTYHIAITAVNANTGHESSLSDESIVTVSAKHITVSWTFPTDPQVTHVRIHIFKEDLTGTFFQVADVDVAPAPNATTGGYDSGTTSVSLNLSDDDIVNLIIESPGIHDNDPPPAGTTFIAYHGSRMYATDGKDLWFSKEDDPESFSPERVELVNPKDGQDIIGFGTLLDAHLLILKERSCYVLEGPDDPNTWEIVELDLTAGLRAEQSLVFTEGAAFWIAEQGFFTVKFGEKPRRLDTLKDLNLEQLGNASGAYDSLHQRVLWSVPKDFSQSNNVILPYNTKLSLWEDEWDPMDVSIVGSIYDVATKTPFVGIGTYGPGRVCRVWDTPIVDGVRMDDGVGNLFTLSGHPSTADVTSLTDITAVFDTDGDGLSQIPVIVVSADGTIVQRNVILSNTATALSLRDEWEVVPNTAWTYYIGSPNFEFDTKYLSPTAAGDGSVFTSRNFKQALVKVVSDTGSATVMLFSILDHDDTNFASIQQVTVTHIGARWDVDEWDVGKFGAAPAALVRAKPVHVPLGIHGKVLGLRVVNRIPNVAVTILSLGLLGAELSYKD